MVKKLFKHEFSALLRLMLPIECAVLGVSVLVRFMTLFETDSVVFESITASAVLMTVAALVAGNIAAVIFGVIRYYKNLFSVEGYLSFTLPVTPAQHIMVKCVTAMIFEIIAVIIALTAFCIATAGNLLVEIADLIAYLFEKAFENVSALHMCLFIVEFIILMLIGLLNRYLLFYACVSIGQTAKKHRVLLAFGAYGIYMLISGFISTIFNILVGIVMIDTELYNTLYSFFYAHTNLCIHIFFLVSAVISILLAVVYFIISHTIIRKKLNLE